MLLINQSATKKLIVKSVCFHFQTIFLFWKTLNWCKKKEIFLIYFLDFFKKYFFNIFSNIKNILKSDFYYYYEHPQNIINQGQHSLKMAISWQCIWWCPIGLVSCWAQVGIGLANCQTNTLGVGCMPDLIGHGSIELLDLSSLGLVMSKSTWTCV